MKYGKKKEYWGQLDWNSHSLLSFPLLAELLYVVQKGLRLQTIVADDFLKLSPNIPQVLFSLERCYLGGPGGGVTKMMVR